MMRFAKKLLRFLPKPLRHWAIRRGMKLDEQELGELEVRVASSIEDYVGAARLIHDGYVRRGLCTSHGSGVRLTPFSALPSTIVFVAFRRGELVGTISLVTDSSLGLPMEKIYGEEVDSVRRQGRRIAEVGSLCVAREYRGLGVTYLLNKAMQLCAARLLGVQDLMIAVHPDAADLYEATLCFDRIGGVKQYPSLNRSAPAAPLRLRLAELPTIYFERFGHLPANAQNPHHLYVERVDANIVLPDDAPALQRLASIHRLATLKLFALRPDTVTELGNNEFERLRRELCVA